MSGSCPEHNVSAGVFTHVYAFHHLPNEGSRAARIVWVMTRQLTKQLRKRPFLLTLGLALLISAPLSLASAKVQYYSLELFLDGKPLQWDSGEGSNRNGEFFGVEDLSEPLTVYFDGGQLELHLADWGTFDQPHVTGMRFSRESAPNTLSMGATVRHNDQSWDDYADTIVFDGAENGRLTLAHPHDDEQPFTRSKSGVRAEGPVRIYALDNVRSGDGSAIIIDFSQAPFKGLGRGTLSYELTPDPQN